MVGTGRKKDRRGGGGGGAEEFEWVKRQRVHLAKRLSQNLGLWGQRAELLELFEHFVLSDIIPYDAIIFLKGREGSGLDGGKAAAAAAAKATREANGRS
jgi:hypothetical protein